MPIGMRRWHYKRLVKAKEEEKKAMKIDVSDVLTVKRIDKKEERNVKRNVVNVEKHDKRIDRIVEKNEERGVLTVKRTVKNADRIVEIVDVIVDVNGV